MFTGIIETLGRVRQLRKEGSNLHIEVQTPLSAELKIDQSVSHNGVCLTVVESGTEQYTVTAIEETLKRTNLGNLRAGDLLNLERAMILGARLDGHLVQGHIDQTGNCTGREERAGSTLFAFDYDPASGNVTIEKGSITIDGVSLTVVDSGPGSFSVAIIPYTLEHTLFHAYTPGSLVNLEFDLIGKYVKRLVTGK